jgi:hypothetical protein
LAGIGKSRLIEETKRRARRAGMGCLESAGDAMESSTAYYAWRGIFAQALGLVNRPFETSSSRHPSNAESSVSATLIFGTRVRRKITPSAPLATLAGAIILPG